MSDRAKRMLGLAGHGVFLGLLFSLAVALLVSLVGCGQHEDHKNRVHPVIVEEVVEVTEVVEVIEVIEVIEGIQGDVDGDGDVDSDDLDLLRDLLGDPDISDPFPPHCDVNLDGFFTWADELCLFDLILLRCELEIEDDDDDEGCDD